MRTETTHGLPFDLKLAAFLDSQLKRVLHDNRASLIIVEGGVGVGKTNADVHIADYLNGAYKRIGPDTWKFDPKKAINLKETLGMGGQQFISCLKTAYRKEQHVVVYDEAGDFSKRSTLTMFNNLINRIFDTYRAFKVIVIVSLPSFAYIDQAILDKQISRVLIRIKDRDHLRAEYEAYDLLTMHLIKYFMKKIPVKLQAYDRVRPNWRGYILPLPKERSEELTKISTKGKFGILEQAELKGRGLLTYAEICARVNRSYNWVIVTFSKMKVKPVQYVNKKAYFAPEVVSLLIQAIDTAADNVQKDKEAIRAGRGEELELE